MIKKKLVLTTSTLRILVDRTLATVVGGADSAPIYGAVTGGETCGTAYGCLSNSPKKTYCGCPTVSS